MEPAEFPVAVGRETYVVPAIGLAALAAQAGAVLAMLLGAVVGTPFLTAAAHPRFEGFIAAWCGCCGGAAVMRWLRRTWRIDHERKLIIGTTGLAYHAFADQVREAHWDDVLRVVEEEPRGLGEGRTLVYTVPGGTFTIDEWDYEGYREIRRLTIARLPAGRVRLAASGV
jgi:hypothetical protein